MRGPSLRTMGFGNVAEDRQDIVTLRCARFKALLSRVLLPCLLVLGGGGSPGPELRAAGRQRPVARRRGLGPGRGRRHVAPGPARSGAVQGHLDPYRQPQPCRAHAGQRRGPPPRPGDHAQAFRRAAGRGAALAARPRLRGGAVVQPQPQEGQCQHLLHDPGDPRHRVRDPRRPGAEPAHRARGRGGGEQRRRASCRCPGGRSAVARPARRRSSTWSPARATPCNGRCSTRRSSPPRRAMPRSCWRRSGWPPPATSPVPWRPWTGHRLVPGVDTYRASLLLQVGRVDEARSRDRRGAGGRPAGRQAYALRSIVQVVQNEREDGAGRRAEGGRARPQLGSARIALSYAQQANFDLEGARATLLQADRRTSPTTPWPGRGWARSG